MQQTNGTCDERQSADLDPLTFSITGRDRNTIAMVREAVRNRQVALAFQPVTQSVKPDRIAFHEGLMRIFDPAGRVIPAADFITAIEATETGRDIDVLALEMGLDALAEAPDIRLSINMSARSIGYPRWMRALKDGLMRDATAAERLILEITESSAMLVPELVKTFMADLGRQGISFALDDFGSGNTSFRHLRDFRFDMLKIDGDFIRDVARSRDNQVLVSALVMIADQFDMFTVAEAVETAEDADWLSDIGIDCLQGYYFAAPTLYPAWSDPQVRDASA